MQYIASDAHKKYTWARVEDVDVIGHSCLGVGHRRWIRVGHWGSLDILVGWQKRSSKARVLQRPWRHSHGETRII